MLSFLFRLCVASSPEPFFLQQGAQVLVSPPLVAIDALSEMGFPLHAELLNGALGWRVLRLALRNHALDLQRLEPVLQQCRRSLGRVSLSVIPGVKDPADLEDEGVEPGMKAYVPN
jgi:hypothetical protein